jgi:hypothetical protein
MALHYGTALSQCSPCTIPRMTKLCAFSGHCARCTVCTAGTSHQACTTFIRVPSYEQFSSESRCEKHSIYPLPYLHGLQSAGIHLRYGKLSSRRLAPHAEYRIVNGSSKINSLILPSSFVIRVLLLFYEMQLLPGMP